MITNLLLRWYDVKFNDLNRIDVKPDVHVIRVFYRLGFISKADSQSALLAARKLNPAYPGALDAGVWLIGRKYCNATGPVCQQCPIDSCCPKNI
jgi:endonuclease III